MVTLPRLTSLDISGTNLAGTDATSGGELCDIAGLSSRVTCPLEFLGLYKTRNSASGWTHIPALTVSGDSNEEQILEAGRRYMDRPTVLENILNDLFHVFRYETCRNLRQAASKRLDGSYVLPEGGGLQKLCGRIVILSKNK